MSCKSSHLHEQSPQILSKQGHWPSEPSRCHVSRLMTRILQPCGKQTQGGGGWSLSLGCQAVLFDLSDDSSTSALAGRSMCDLTVTSGGICSSSHSPVPPLRTVTHTAWMTCWQGYQPRSSHTQQQHKHMCVNEATYCQNCVLQQSLNYYFKLP